MEKLAEECLNAFGKVDILVNSAGRIKRAPTLDFDEADWNGIIDNKPTGTLRACQVFGRHMIERGKWTNHQRRLCWVVPGSLRKVAAYCASKAAVASLTQSLAVEWASYGITVNSIVPGVIRTSLNAKLIDKTPRGDELLLRTPMKRFGKPEDLAGAAIFLASDAASFVSGEMLRVDGGMLASGVNQ